MLEIIEKTKEEKVKEKRNAITYEITVTATGLCNQVNQIGAMLFDTSDPEITEQDILDSYGEAGALLLQLLGGSKQLLSLLGTENYPVIPAPKALRYDAELKKGVSEPKE